MPITQPERRSQSIAQRIAANTALVLFGIVLAFGLAEIVLRVSGLAEPNFYVYDAYRGWSLHSGAAGWQRQEGGAFIQVNREGFRGPDCRRAKPKGTLRIAVLGDSFAEAVQVPIEQTFCSVMQRELAANCP